MRIVIKGTVDQVLQETDERCLFLIKENDPVGEKLLVSIDKRFPDLNRPIIVGQPCNCTGRLFTKASDTVNGKSYIKNLIYIDTLLEEA